MSSFDASALVRLPRVQTVVPSPDGTWLAAAVQRLDEKGTKYVSDLWRVPSDGGPPQRLTHSGADDFAPAFLHDGRLAFLSRRVTDTDEKGKRPQVFALGPWGEPEQLTDEPLGVASFAAAAEADVLVCAVPLTPGVPDDEQRSAADERGVHGPTALVYDSMPVRHWDHWLPAEHTHLVCFRDGVRTDLVGNPGRAYSEPGLVVSRDGRLVVATRTSEGPDRVFNVHLDLITVDSGERREIAGGERTWWYSPVFSPDGSRLGATRQERGPGSYGKGQLHVIDVDSGEARPVAGAFDYSLSAIGWGPDGKTLVATASHHTHCPVFVVDVETDAVSRITAETAGGSHQSCVLFERDGAPHVAGVRSTRLQPPEPFVVPLEPGATPHQPASLTGWQLPEDLEVISTAVESTDGTPVQFAVVRPRDAERLPVLLWIHGGPVADWGDIWHWRWNPVVAAREGFAVVLPNPRGSTGFGQQYIEEIWGNTWGGQCFEDLMAVTDAVAADHRHDEDRLVAMGGSFGGYMTNWIGTQTDRFRCLVTHAGLFDLATFHGTTDWPAWWSTAFNVDPYADRKGFARYSASAEIARWASPTLVVHGDKDYRVPIGEALALFEALQAHGVESKLLVFPDENHWILRPTNIVSWYDTIFAWIHEHVDGE